MCWHKLLELRLKDLVRYLLDPLKARNGFLVTDYDSLVTTYIYHAKDSKTYPRAMKSIFFNSLLSVK